jgi:hypothetical protein
LESGKLLLQEENESSRTNPKIRFFIVRCRLVGLPSAQTAPKKLRGRLPWKN